MEKKTEIWIMSIISFFLFIFSIYTIFSQRISVVPDWYPDIVDVRLLGCVIGLFGFIISVILLKDEYHIVG